MNFMEAIQAMRDGKRVKRKDWVSGLWIGSITESILDNEGVQARFSLSQVEATDWEIYEKEDDWNLANVSKKNPSGEYLETDIKTFIKKIKQKDYMKNRKGMTFQDGVYSVFQEIDERVGNL